MACPPLARPGALRFRAVARTWIIGIAALVLLAAAASAQDEQEFDGYTPG